MTLIDADAAIDTLNEQIEQCNKALGSFDISLKDEYAIKVERASLEAYKEQLENMPPIQPERKKPVFKTGESVYHVSYADGTGGFEKNKWADWTCPDCGWFVGEQYIPRRRNQQKCNYCAKCGCAIDWSDADIRGDKHETD